MKEYFYALLICSARQDEKGQRDKMGKRKKITVTNHAIRRYIERGYNIKGNRNLVQDIEKRDREKIIDELLNMYNSASLINTKNEHTYYLSGNLVLVVEHGTRRLKTILYESKFKL